MKIYACLATLFFFVSSVDTFAQLSGPITNSANGHYYYLLNGYLSWGDAEASAVAMNGHLVTIRSAVENQWLQDTFRPAVGSVGPLWIGLNDREVEDSFVWTSGAPLIYSNWEPGAPDNLAGSEDAAYLSSSGQWNDTQDNFIGFVEGAIIEVIPPPPSSCTSNSPPTLSSVGTRKATCTIRSSTLRC